MAIGDGIGTGLRLRLGRRDSRRGKTVKETATEATAGGGGR
jgi:hypothetical protein